MIEAQTIRSAFVEYNIPHSAGGVTAKSFWITAKSIARLPLEFRHVDVKARVNGSLLRVKQNIRELLHHGFVTKINNHYQKNIRDLNVAAFYEYTKNGQYHEALKAFQRALGTDPIFGHILTHFFAKQSTIHKEEFIAFLKAQGYRKEHDFYYDKAFAFVAGVLHYARIVDFHNQHKVMVKREKPEHLEESDLKIAFEAELRQPTSRPETSSATKLLVEGLVQLMQQPQKLAAERHWAAYQEAEHFITSFRARMTQAYGYGQEECEMLIKQIMKKINTPQVRGEDKHPPA